MTEALRPARRITIVQGEFIVVDDPGVAVATLLGSCVAACLRDPIAKVGGMNHFLLPDGPEWRSAGAGERYGLHLMELLVNELLKRGARRERLEAKLFGGARLVRGLSDIGARNAAFAERFLRDERIRHLGGSLGGTEGRRIEFWPVSGRARQSLIGMASAPDPVVAAPPAAPAALGDVELF